MKPILSILCLLLAPLLFACGGGDGGDTSGSAASQGGAGSSESGGSAGELILYCGRSESLAGEIIARFEAESGIDVRVKYGGSAQLALALEEEGDRSAADVFWAQDAGALGVMAKSGRFAPIPKTILDRVPPLFRHPEGLWIATSGRGRVLAYSPDRTETAELPTSVSRLTDPVWKNRVGWAPANASFQAFVTAMRLQWGEEKTEAWLRAMKDNGAKSYPKNTAILEAIAAGEVDLGLPNHYYLLRFKAENPDFPVAQTYFRPGDPGNLVNVAGCGVLRTSSHPETAAQFLAFLLSDGAQRYFAQDVFEYPMVRNIEASSGVMNLPGILRLAPHLPLNELEDLDASLGLLRKVGLL